MSFILYTFQDADTLTLRPSVSWTLTRFKKKSKPFEKHSVWKSYSPLFFGNIFRFSAQTSLFTSTTIADPADLQLEDMTCFSESQQCIKFSSGNSNFQNVFLFVFGHQKNIEEYIQLKMIMFHVFTSFFVPSLYPGWITSFTKKSCAVGCWKWLPTHPMDLPHVYIYVCSTCHLIYPPEV